MNNTEYTQKIDGFFRSIYYATKNGNVDWELLCSETEDLSCDLSDGDSGYSCSISKLGSFSLERWKDKECEPVEVIDVTGLARLPFTSEYIKKLYPIALQIAKKYQDVDFVNCVESDRNHAVKELAKFVGALTDKICGKETNA